MSESGLRWLTWILLVDLALAIASPAFAGQREGTANVNLFLGRKSLDGAAWEPSDEQFEAGIEASWGKRSWPVLIATDYFWSSDQSMSQAPPTRTLAGQVSMSTMELGLGFRKVWQAGTARPYWGAGVVAINAHQERFREGFVAGVPVDLVTRDRDANAFGGWIGAGTFWRMREHFNLGVAARYSIASTPLIDYTHSGSNFTTKNFNAGGFHAGLILGWGWQPATTGSEGAGSPASPKQSAGLVHVFVGGKTLDHNDWAPADVQSEMGIEFSLGKRTWLVLIAIDYFSSDDVVPIKKKAGNFPSLEVIEDEPASTAEYAIGIRRLGESEHMRRFFGGGVMAVFAERDFSVPVPCDYPCKGASSMGAGIWAGGGVAWKVGPVFDVGFEARYSTGRVGISDGIDPGGLHFGVALGGGWPRKAPAPSP